MIDSGSSANTSLENPVKSQDVVFWARMSGFPWWPARYCTEAEKKLLLKTCQPSLKIKQTAVTFLGKKLDKGWVADNGIAEFSPNTFLKYYHAKKIKTDKEYKSAVVESMRVQRRVKKYQFQSINPLRELYNEGFEALQEFYLEESEILAENDNSRCITCNGTDHSGPLNECLECGNLFIHWHCLDILARDAVGHWLCPSCCEIFGLQYGELLPFSTTIPDNNTANTHSSIIASDKTNKNHIKDSSISNKNSQIIINSPSIITISNSKINKKDFSTANISNKRISIDREDSMISTVMKANSNNNGSLNYHNTNVIIPIDNKNDVIANKIIIENNNEIDDKDNICFVCGLEGKLLICDFPSCVRVFHQVCVIKTMPFPLNEDETLDLDCCSDDQPWFCPCHNCVNCGVLQTTTLHISQINLPLTYYFTINDKINNLLLSNIKQKQLFHCQTCPFSICDDCEYDLTQSKTSSVFSTKRLTQVTECMNCSSNNPILRLSKLFEKSWVKMVSSRLATPFLRPLLPLLSENDNIQGSNNINGIDQKNNYNSNNNNNEDTLNDLMSIIENIRQLKYSSLKIFHSELNKIRNVISIKTKNHIIKLYPTSYSEFNYNNNNYNYNDPISHPSYVCIMNAYDTIISCGLSYLDTKLELINMIEKDLNEQMNNNNNLNNNNNNLNNNNNNLNNNNDNNNNNNIVDVPTSQLNENDNKLQSNNELTKIKKKPKVDESNVLTTTRKRKKSKLYFDNVEEEEEGAVSNTNNINNANNNVKSKKLSSSPSDNIIPAVTLTFKKAANNSNNNINSNNSNDKDNNNNNNNNINNNNDNNNKNIIINNNNNKKSNGHVDDKQSRMTSAFSSSISDDMIISPTRQNNIKFKPNQSKELVKELMLQLWRKECSNCIINSETMQPYHNQNNNNNNNSYTNSNNCYNNSNYNNSNNNYNNYNFNNKINGIYPIAKRTLKGWVYFLEEGMMPIKSKESYGRVDPWMVQSIIENNEKITYQNGQMTKDIINNILSLEKNDLKIREASEIDAANWMVNMQNSNLRETISLFEGSYSVTSSDHNNNHKNNDNNNNYIQTDETLIILDRLKEVTTKALQLETRLREEYSKQNHRLRIDGKDTISISQLGVINEMKIVNDDLKWRLQQRNNIIKNDKMIIKDLSFQLKRKEQELDKTRQERDELQEK
eukprot:gene11077-14872_t